MMTGTMRIVIAVIVALACAILLDPMAPDLAADPGNSDAYAFWLKVDGAVRYFFAIAIGAVIARQSFIVPATAIVVAAWVSVVYVLYKIALPAGPVDLSQVAVSNLDGLVMMVLAGVVGAMTGRWFYRREIASA